MGTHPIFESDFDCLTDQILNTNKRVGMERKLDQYNEKSKKTNEHSETSTGVGGDNVAWDILIPKLDFQSQMKISQQNQRLAEVVKINAEHKLRKFQGHIRDDKYIARKCTNPANWSFYRALIWIFEEQNTTKTRSRKQSQNSAIATLAKAEILAKKLSRGQDGLYETEWQDWYRVSKGTTFVNNEDWELKFKLSPHQFVNSKLKVCELSTGKDKTEEWSLLPKGSFYPLMGDNGIVFEDHFFVLNFDARGGGGDLLIVTLISRKKFWIKKELLENQIKAHAVENPPNHENPPNFNNFWFEKSKVCAIIVDTDGINMVKPYGLNYEIQFYRNGIEKILDATLEFKLDDQKEITDYEVIEAELRSLELVSDSDDSESDSDDGGDQL